MGSGRRWKIKGRVHEIRDMSAKVWVHMTGVRRPVHFTFEGKATKQQETWTGISFGQKEACKQICGAAIT